MTKMLEKIQKLTNNKRAKTATASFMVAKTNCIEKDNTPVTNTQDNSVEIESVAYMNDLKVPKLYEGEEIENVKDRPTSGIPKKLESIEDIDTLSDLKRYECENLGKRPRFRKDMSDQVYEIQCQKLIKIWREEQKQTADQM